MQFYLLDFISFTLTDVILLALLASVIIGVVEALIILPFKVNTAGKVFLFTIAINVISSGMGLALQYWYTEVLTSIALQWLIAFVLSVLIEGFLFVLLNKRKEEKKVWQAVLVANMVTYGILIAFTTL